MMFLSMRATRDAARRGEHVAGWRLDAGRGAILRECPAVRLPLCALLFLPAWRARPPRLCALLSCLQGKAGVLTSACCQARPRGGKLGDGMQRWAESRAERPSCRRER